MLIISTAQNAYHVVFTDKGTATTVNPVVLDGLTVMYGQTDDKLSYSTKEDEQGRGGGIYSNGVTYSISRCRLLNNTAVRGGAVFVRNADLNLSGCILSGNKTVENTATGQTTTLTSRGGAAYVSGIDKEVNLRAVNTLWANNESAGEGGAIGTNYAEGISSSHDPLLYIMNNTFVRNKATTNLQICLIFTMFPIAPATWIMSGSLLRETRITTFCFPLKTWPTMDLASPILPQ